MNEKNIDQLIDSIFARAADFICAIVLFSLFTIHRVEVPFIMVWLAAGAVFFTLYLKFVNLWGFKYAIDIVKGKYTHEGDPGEITHFQVLMAAHQGFSANLYSILSDIFPKRAVTSVVIGEVCLVLS